MFYFYENLSESDLIKLRKKSNSSWQELFCQEFSKTVVDSLFLGYDDFGNEITLNKLRIQSQVFHDKDEFKNAFNYNKISNKFNFFDIFIVSVKDCFYIAYYGKQCKSGELIINEWDSNEPNQFYLSNVWDKDELKTNYRGIIGLVKHGSFEKGEFNIPLDDVEFIMQINLSSTERITNDDETFQDDLLCLDFNQLKEIMSKYLKLEYVHANENNVRNTWSTLVDDYNDRLQESHDPPKPDNDLPKSDGKLFSI